MKLVALFLFAILCGSALAAVSAVARVDDFSVDSPALVIIVQGNLPTTQSNFVVGNNILGGERDLSLTAITGANNLVLSAGVSTGTFNSAAPKGANGESIIQYDGSDNSIELDPSGLFSNGGNNFALNNAFALRTNITADIATNVFFRIYSGSTTNFCEYRQPIPGNSIPKLYTLNYSQFNKTGSGCDFSNVGAFEVEVDLAQNVDIAIDLIEIVADNPTPSRTPTRTPSSRPASPSRTRTPSPTRAAASASRTRTPTPTRAAPSESRTRTPTPSRAAASASRTRTPTPSRAPASASRTRTPSQIPRSPSNTPSPTSCICTCPELECIMFQYGENTFNGRGQRNIIDEFAVIDQNAQEEEGFDFLQLF